VEICNKLGGLWNGTSCVMSQPTQGPSTVVVVQPTPAPAGSITPPSTGSAGLVRAILDPRVFVNDTCSDAGGGCGHFFQNVGRCGYVRLPFGLRGFWFC
jgi:hypothetical protein